VERQIVIKYSWWRLDKEPIDSRHMLALEERAEEYVVEELAAGYIDGTLEDNVYMLDTDPKYGVEYQGSWELCRS